MSDVVCMARLHIVALRRCGRFAQDRRERGVYDRYIWKLNLVSGQ